MKRILTLAIVSLLAVASVFAGASTSVVRLKSYVDGIRLSEAHASVSGGLFNLSIDTDEGSDSKFVTSSNDVSKDNVIVIFRITQMAATKTFESISLTVTANPMSYTDETGAFKTEDPVLTGSGNSELGSEYFSIHTIGEYTNSLQIDINYGGGMEVPAETMIYEFQSEWGSEPSLAEHPGTYSSNIVLSYTIA